MASSHYSRRDWLYLSAYEGEDKAAPKGYREVLLADCAGKLTTALVDRLVCKRIKASVEPEPWAALCLELTRKTYMSFAVRIDDETSDALKEILQLAFERKPPGHNWTIGVSIPEHLTNYVRKVIDTGQNKREAFKRELEERVGPLLSPVPTDPSYEQLVLDTGAHLAQHRGFTVHKLIQLQKNDITDPNIILGRLHPDELTLPGLQKLLVLDSEGDLACSWLKTDTIDGAEQNLKRSIRAKRKPGVLICSNVEQGLMMIPLSVTRSQEKRLQDIKIQWEKTGYPPAEISDDIQLLLRVAKLTADAFERGTRAKSGDLH
jgi:hypothetical protein